MKKITTKIQELRKSKGWSYENMANDLNISVAAYRKIEICQTKLTVNRLFQICEILKIDPTQLLCEQTVEDSIQNPHLKLDEKLIEQYEARLKEKDEIIHLLKSKLSRSLII